MARKQIGYTCRMSSYQFVRISRLSVPTPPQKIYSVKISHLSLDLLRRSIVSVPFVSIFFEMLSDSVF